MFTRYHYTEKKGRSQTFYSGKNKDLIDACFFQVELILNDFTGYNAT